MTHTCTVAVASTNPYDHETFYPHTTAALQLYKIQTADMIRYQTLINTMSWTTLGIADIIWC